MFEISKLKEKKLAELQEIAQKLNISKFKTSNSKQERLVQTPKTLTRKPNNENLRKKITTKLTWSPLY